MSTRQQAGERRPKKGSTLARMIAMSYDGAGACSPRLKPHLSEGNR
jgi:hypothetical protein